jgi:hypothetical protein
MAAANVFGLSKLTVFHTDEQQSLCDHAHPLRTLLDGRSGLQVSGRLLAAPELKQYQSQIQIAKSICSR